MIRALVTILLVSLVAGFLPPHAKQTSLTSSALQFKFLKEMGLEKPSWLPDFGGKKEEEEVAVPVAAVEDDEEVAEEEEEAEAEE
mmetsp:Transcript_31588/g.65993  ORF Transcript_31588/g.65993 Transcript_31588/m.65993 type:complete len:85 (+) Transcript_31588:135-389(+)|eukprot:CAMPEP_0172462370 /NCGR_PEP_ID=MMETSP1065-20121228/43661_1 /TAXON_ID=265537 /ORGANISM="Amphiprora paludosa, Strain CCMP125" /LENGTH=84 /DNA_ID=CAMNT_0013218003 /DNA_START=87 /DNA_END=341 /DNA_ORIENTATION=+